MKVTATLAALSLGLASVGLAQAADLTRAEVVQQLHEAQAQGLVTIGEQGNYPVESAPSTLSRSEVVNALRLARPRARSSSANRPTTRRPAPKAPPRPAPRSWPNWPPRAPTAR